MLYVKNAMEQAHVPVSLNIMETHIPDASQSVSSIAIVPRPKRVLIINVSIHAPACVA